MSKTIDWTKPVRAVKRAQELLGITPDVSHRGTYLAYDGDTRHLVIVNYPDGKQQVYSLHPDGTNAFTELEVENAVEDVVRYILWGYLQNDSQKRVTMYDTYTDRADAEKRLKIGSLTYVFVGITEARMSGEMIAAAINANP